MCPLLHFDISLHKKFWSNNIYLIRNAVWRKTFWQPHTNKNVRKCRLQRNTGKTFRQNPKCRLRRNKSTTFWHKSDDCILAAAPSNSLLLCLANFDLNMEIFWGLTSWLTFCGFFSSAFKYWNSSPKMKEKAFLWTQLTLFTPAYFGISGTGGGHIVPPPKYLGVGWG